MTPEVKAELLSLLGASGESGASATLLSRIIDVLEELTCEATKMRGHTHMYENNTSRQVIHGTTGGPDYGGSL